MAVTYCTAAQVASMLHVASFTGSTDPTQTEVEDRINEIEDYIDRETGHAWRAVTITREYHDFPADASYGESAYNDGVPIFLDHRAIRLTAGLQLDTGAGDKLEVFDGSTWEDWTATRTDGRGDDFWVEPDKGILWIRTILYTPRKRSIRLTYRYGESSVPNDIRRATILLVAADLVLGEDSSIVLPDTGGSTAQTPYINRANQWRSKAEDIIFNHKEYASARV